MDESSRPVAGAAVEVWGAGESEHVLFGTTDPEGRFRLEGIPDEDGRPAFRAGVGLHDGPAEHAWARTDGHGGALLAGLPQGPLELRVTSSGHAPLRRRVELDGPTAVRVRLEPEATLRVRARHRGKPLLGSRVAIQDAFQSTGALQETWTDTQGEAFFGGLAAGRHTVVLTVGRDTVTSRVELATGRESETTLQLDQPAGP